MRDRTAAASDKQIGEPDPLRVRTSRNRMSANTNMIRRVSASDLTDLLRLMRAYCDFYKASPPDEDLLALALALLDRAYRVASPEASRGAESGAV